MRHPTDDELEALAARLDKGDPFGGVMQRTAAMLRACKGRRWQTMESAPIFGKVLRYDPRRREGEQVFECPADGGFWRHEKVPGMWMHMPEPPAALEPAPDHSDWDAAIEAAADKAYLQADIDARPQAISEAIRALKKGTPR